MRNRRNAGSLVRPAIIKAIKGDNKLAMFHLAAYDKDSEDTKFFTASVFIIKGKNAVENFYVSLDKGQLVSVEYKESKGYTNVYNMLKREAGKKTDRKGT